MPHESPTLQPSPLMCLNRFLSAVGALQAIPVGEAASRLGIHKASVYRLIKTGQLETIPRMGKPWVTARSLLAFSTENYSATSKHNVLAELVETCSACRSCSTTLSHP